MIVRLIVIDPAPRDPRDDVIVFPVPGGSRAQELLVEMLERCKLEHVTLESHKKPKKPPQPDPRDE